MSIPKEELHRLVDLLPEKAIYVARKFLEFIVEDSHSDDINWLDVELADWPSYDWGPKGVSSGKPVHFIEGKGLEIREG